MKYKPVSLIVSFLFVIFFNILMPRSWGQTQNPPTFVIFAYGFWGNLDRLPSQDPSWLRKSPYPHIRKRQDVSFLNSPDYRPIPQAMLTTGEGPSISKYLFCSYYQLEHEMAYWAERINSQSQKERIKIFDNWQLLRERPNDYQISDINVIYLKYDWRLELPQVERDYIEPLIDFIDRHWPGAEIHWIGHSLGGVVGRYTVSCHPGRFTSLISIGGPQYGIYEIGMQCRGERVTYDGKWDLENAQEIGLQVAEKIFFGTHTVRPGINFAPTAAKFIRRYLPMMHWMDPETADIEDGFGSLPILEEAVPHAIAIYGLGFGSYDLQGRYHPALADHFGVGPGLAPSKDAPLEYAYTGDGRVDPISAVGPFKNTLCIGKDYPHGSMMWSPLILTFLIDRYYYQGEMNPQDLWLSMRRLNVPFIDREQRIKWVLAARKVWNAGNN
jgi:pimeloyl-ACP methyl ester carboxylesterase